MWKVVLAFVVWIIAKGEIVAYRDLLDAKAAPPPATPPAKPTP